MIPECEVFVCRNLVRAADTMKEQIRHLYRERAEIVARWHMQGATYAEIAFVLNISRSRAQQLVESIRGKGPDNE